jgi:hypothetical protein
VTTQDTTRHLVLWALDNGTHHLDVEAERLKRAEAIRLELAVDTPTGLTFVQGITREQYGEFGQFCIDVLLTVGRIRDHVALGGLPMLKLYAVEQGYLQPTPGEPDPRELP